MTYFEKYWEEKQQTTCLTRESIAQMWNEIMDKAANMVQAEANTTKFDASFSGAMYHAAWKIRGMMV